MDDFPEDDDLRTRDLSQVPESELTLEERRELKRRFQEFVDAMQGKPLSSIASKPKAKKITKWNPAQYGGRLH